MLSNVNTEKIVRLNGEFATVVGPSHCVRFEHAIATGQLPAMQRTLKFIGVGGMPIWSPRIMRELSANSACAAPFFIVGDFRFGNAILKHISGEIAFPVGREHLAVQKELINEANDKILYDLSMTAACAIAKEIPAARLLFWDLTIREFENRSSGKYQDNGVYRHPVWNLDTVLSTFSDIAVDSHDMLPFAERLFIDSSGHPSLLGWIYIFQHVQGRQDVDLARLVKAYELALDRTMGNLFGGQVCVITGDSKFTRLLEKFVKLGIFSLPAGCVITSVRNAVNFRDSGTCLYFPPMVTYAMDENEITAQVTAVARNRALLQERFTEVSVLFYDNWEFECVSKRKDYAGMYVSQHEIGRTAALEAQTCLAGQCYRITESLDYEGMVELNNTVVPTVLGMIEILGRAMSGCSNEDIRRAYGKILAEINDDSLYMSTDGG